MPLAKSPFLLYFVLNMLFPRAVLLEEYNKLLTLISEECG